MKTKKIFILITLLASILSKRAKSHRRSRRLRYNEDDYLPSVYEDDNYMVDRLKEKEGGHHHARDYYNNIYKYNGDDASNIMANRPDSDEEENVSSILGSDDKMKALIKKKKKHYESVLIDIYKKGESVKQLFHLVTEINDILDDTSQKFSSELNNADQLEEHNYMIKLARLKAKRRRKKQNKNKNQYFRNGEYRGELGTGIQHNPFDGYNRKI